MLLLPAKRKKVISALNGQGKVQGKEANEERRVPLEY